jgi:SAM-dependent methyltransferase
MATNQDTVRSYEASAAEYAAKAATMPEWVLGEIDAFVEALSGTGRILEIGSGGGRDAAELQRRGLSVRCTDVARGFVDLLRAEGFEADHLDPLTDDLTDPRRPDTPYDGVWSCACLFHVARDDLVTVLTHLAVATRPGGRIHASFKEGDGDVQSSSSTDPSRRYSDTLWREPDLRTQFAAAGWVVDGIGRHGNESWLAVRGHQPGRPASRSGQPA